MDKHAVEQNAPRGKKRGPITRARELPATGYARLETVLAVVPIGKSSWWAGVKAGRFPRGVKLGPRVTAWRVEDVRALLERFSQNQPAA